MHSFFALLKTVRRVLGRVITSVAGAVARRPIGEHLLKRAALAPIWMKSRWFEAVFVRVASQARRPEQLIETNAGISEALRLRIPLRKGDLIYGRPKNHIGERASLELACYLALHTCHFIDVGANDGIFTFAVANTLEPSRHADIHVFEPNGDVFARLAANLKGNSIRVNLNEVAAGRAKGFAKLQYNPRSDDMGSLNAHFAKRVGTRATEVAVVSLADYMRERGLWNAVVKVDVEGYGAEVWDGLRGERDRVAYLIMEMISPEWSANLPSRIVEETGWYAYYIRDYSLNLWRHGPYACLEPCYNWLFCRFPPSELAAFVAPITRFRVGEVA